MLKTRYEVFEADDVRFDTEILSKYVWIFQQINILKILYCLRFFVGAKSRRREYDCRQRNYVIHISTIKF